MTEDEANNLIAEVGNEVEEAIAQWRLQGAGSNGAGIHQIFTRSMELSDGDTLLNEPNLSGIVGVMAGQAYSLLWDGDGQEYVVPYSARRYDSTFTRYAPASAFDFILIGVGATVKMRIYINDAFGGGVQGMGATANIDASNLSAVGGGRPYMEISNDGNQYAIFRTAECTRVIRQAYENALPSMPLPDTVTDNLFRYRLFKRSNTTGTWMPSSTYDTSDPFTYPVTYSGTIWEMVSGRNAMGFRTVDVQVDGGPITPILFFIADEMDRGNPITKPQVFRLTDAEMTYYDTNVRVLDTDIFTRRYQTPITFGGGSYTPQYPCP
jgi:hypothetical protein